MSDLVAVGKVVGVFGTKGSLKVLPLTDFPSRIPKLRSAYLVGNEARRHQVLSARRHGRGYCVTLSDVSTAQAARELVGSYVSVPEDELEELPEGTYYGFQVIGCTAFAAGGGEIGRVKDILELPANDVLVIDRSGKEVLVPLAAEFVKEIDIAGKRVVIAPIRGMIDEE